MKDYTKLLVWEKAHLLTLKVYKLTKAFPKDEFFGLVSQLRRASSSVPTNIAEGCGRLSDKELRKFLVIAHGSASEVSYQLILSKDLEYISLDQYSTYKIEIEEVMKMLNAFIQKLNN